MRLPFIHIAILIAFLINSISFLPLAQAQDFNLPEPGVMVHLSLPYDPLILKGIKVHPDNPFRFDFILQKGTVPLSGRGQPPSLKVESIKLIKYFLAALTIPEKDLWVNLSPYEKNRIIPQSFGSTEMGRDLLAEDYMLKQITASLIYPEDEVGRRFWKRVYQEAKKRYGTTNIPVNTFNKVWIVPEKAVVYENAKVGAAYVVESKLKVMLEQDYLSLQKHLNGTVSLKRGEQSPSVKHENSRFPTETLGNDNASTLGCDIMREIVIPELTKEVNENKNFSQLRQVYNSVILATWYKRKIKDSILSQVYANKNKVRGINVDDPKEKQRIYERYVQAFKKGAFNYIKEESDPIAQTMMPRKYFSGGEDLTSFADAAMATTEDESFLPQGISVNEVEESVNLEMVHDQAMSIAAEPPAEFGSWLGENSTRLERERAVLDAANGVLYGFRTDSENYAARTNAYVAQVLLEGGFTSTGELKDEYGVNIEELVNSHLQESGIDQEPNRSDAYENMITGLIRQEQIILNNQNKDNPEVEAIFLKGINTPLYGWQIRTNFAIALRMHIANGLVSQESIEAKGMIGILLKSLAADSDPDVRRACVDVLKAIGDRYPKIKEELIRRISRTRILETLKSGLSVHLDWGVQFENALALKALIAGGLVSREEVRQNNIVVLILSQLNTDLDRNVYNVLADTLNEFIASDFVNSQEAESVVTILLRGFRTDLILGDGRETNNGDALNKLISNGHITHQYE